jgi:hypothetical protein
MGEAGWDRRRFLKVLGAVTASGAASAGVSRKAFGEAAATVCLVADDADAMVAHGPGAWAVGRLTQALEARGIAVTRAARLADVDQQSFSIVAAGAENAWAMDALQELKIAIPATAEAFAFADVSSGQKRALMACGRDALGLVYALTELADLVENAPDAMAALKAVQPGVERPANAVRSVMRSFCSDVEDKPWFNDRAMWPLYFDMLAAQRFNRFNLAFGIGYDFIRHVTDAYFEFTYPFLLKVPGYDVRVPQLANEERESNLAMLKYIAEECVKRGLQFHVGLWMHGYEWIESPHANYTIEGLDKTTHGPYCRDAVRMLLKEIPEISGLTFRIHGESGVQEGSFDFWKTVFDGVATCGRTVALDMHPKGMTAEMTEIAIATKQPVTMSPKYWGEHMGMPYHQADIRKLEKPKAENKVGLMALSEGTRSFLRYGYGDLLREDRRWKVVHRIWPGTQRILLWGDAEFAAAYSRAFQFCGSDGVEIMEPLTFKGRRGSGIAGSRCGYADASLNPRWDWEKFEYSTRVWGRMLYNPETKPEVLRRPLQRQFGKGAERMQSALANVSRILPIVTTAHAPSAGNNMYWPEMYWNQSMVDAEHYGPYSDALEPRVFGNASPFDPAMFLSMNEYAEELLSGNSSGKYTPVEVAQWIEGFAAAGRSALAEADQTASGRRSAAYRRMHLDITIQAGLGEFFGAKFRSGVLFHIFEVSQEQPALQAAISLYRQASEAWTGLARRAGEVYLKDITVGEQDYLRGHWQDRLPAIQKDIAALEAMVDAKPGKVASSKVDAAIRKVSGTPNGVTTMHRRLALAEPERGEALSPTVAAHHSKPARSVRGEPMPLMLAATLETTDVRLHYRHVDQAENYVVAAMEKRGTCYFVSIPGAYTKTEFPIEYYFEVHTEDGDVGLYPGFKARLTSQPYFVVRGA